MKNMMNKVAQGIHEFLERRLGRMHREEGGAVLVMVLAGIVIALMAGMMMYEAGSVSRDKVDSQMAADASAYSASVVKARSMNMVAFANTNKRVIYSISTVYVATYLGILASTAIYWGKCISSWGTNVVACYNAGVGTVQSIMEGIELGFSNLRGIRKGFKNELKGLNNYQTYLINITPWWAWMEGALRSRVNEGSFAMTWPPPGDVAKILDKITEVMQQIDSVISQINSIGGGNILPNLNLGSIIPAHSNVIDSIPLERRDEGKNFLQLIGTGGAYILGWLVSAEHIITQADVYMNGSSAGISKKGQTIIASAGGLIPGSLISFGLLGKNMFDFRIKGAKEFASFQNAFGNSEPEDDWLQATSITAFGYKGRKTRTKQDRTRLNVLKGDWNGASKFQMGTVNGVISVARSEIVYDQSSLAGTIGASMPGGIGQSLAAFTGTPGMWSPRWTARLRPVTLPNEVHGRTVEYGGDGQPIGLKEMSIDTLPFMLLAAVMSLVDDSVDIPSLLSDSINYWMSSGGFEADKMEGIVK